MCGIFGLVANSQTALTKSDFTLILKSLIKLSEPRGREAAGIAIASDNKISTYKRAAKPSEILKSLEFKTFLDSCIIPTGPNDSNKTNVPIAAIGHTRLVTTGTQVFSENNQPIVSDRLVGVHNGIIVNEQSLLPLISNSQKKLESDSAILFSLIDKFYEDSGDPIAAVLKTYAGIKGSASVAFFCDMHPILVLATNTSSLYYVYEKDYGIFLFGSERYILEKLLQERGLAKYWGIKSVQSIKPLTGVIIKFDCIVPEIFSLRTISGKSEVVQSIKKKKPYKIVNSSISHKLLRRCTRCIFPDLLPKN